MRSMIQRAGCRTLRPRRTRGRNGRLLAWPQSNRLHGAVQAVQISVRNRISGCCSAGSSTLLSSSGSTGRPVVRHQPQPLAVAGHRQVLDASTAGRVEVADGQDGQQPGARATAARRASSGGPDSCTVSAPGRAVGRCR